MSAEHYDLGQRLRAAASATPVPRTHYSPTLAPVDPVAVTVTGAGTELVLHAGTADAHAVGTGRDALGALAALGVSPHGEYRTLVVPDRATLSVLAHLARAVTPASTYDDQAAVIAWWVQRAEHPGAPSVLDTNTACRARWVLGTAPDAELDPGTWREWLDVSDDGPTGLLTIAERASDGEALPGLADLYDFDARSWAYYLTRLDAGRDWRRSDSREDAALGLAARCDAAELYASMCLGDPLTARRETHTGTVLTTTVVASEAGRLTLSADRLICRLRPGADVEAWVGSTDALLDPERPTLRATLNASTVTPDGRLVLHVTTTRTAAKNIAVADTLTLRPRSVGARQQSADRQNMRARYRITGNWLATGRTPTPRRRTVPLDVVIAAADPAD